MLHWLAGMRSGGAGDGYGSAAINRGLATICVLGVLLGWYLAYLVWKWGRGGRG